MFIIQLAIVLACIVIGARMGGLGLGVMGGIGLVILVFIFHCAPASAPIDVMLIIAAVVTAAGTLQATGGMDLLVHWAEKALRKNPSHITFVAPIVTYFFTFFAGTGHVAYAVLPIIAEVATDAGVRPERPMSISVVSSQLSITAGPISAAMAAMVSMMGNYDISLAQIMLVCVPSTFIASMIGAFVVRNRGVELKDDPEYQRRVKEGLISISADTQKDFVPSPAAKTSVVLFLVGALAVVVLGSASFLRPSFPTTADPSVMKPVSMPQTIEMAMLTIAALIIFAGLKMNKDKDTVDKVVKGSVWQAGMTAVIAIFGIAWMSDTMVQANKTLIVNGLSGVAQSAPWAFAFVLFFMSVLMYSQGATTQTMMPVGLAIGVSPAMLVGMFPAVNGLFFIPNYPTVVAAMQFDRTGTTSIRSANILNHSFQLPGTVAVVCSVIIGILLAPLVIH